MVISIIGIDTILMQDALKDEKAAVNAFLNSLLIKPVTFMILHSFLLALSFLSCCASCCEFRTMLRGLCGAFIVTIAYLAIILVFFKFILRQLENVEGSLKTSMMTNFWRLYNEVSGHNMSSEFTFEMNGLQVLNECCGVNSYKDYENATLWKAGIVGRNNTVPGTCCKINKLKFLTSNIIEFTVNNCMRIPTAENSYMERGCFTEVLKLTRGVLGQGIYTTTILAAVLLLMMALFAWQIVMVNKRKKLRDLMRPVSVRRIAVEL